MDTSALVANVRLATHHWLQSATAFTFASGPSAGHCPTTTPMWCALVLVVAAAAAVLIYILFQPLDRVKVKTSKKKTIIVRLFLLLLLLLLLLLFILLLLFVFPASLLKLLPIIFSYYNIKLKTGMVR